MQAIQVKVLPPTNVRGTRLKAWSHSDGSITRGRDYSLNIEEDMANAACELARKLEWPGEFRGGILPNGDMCFVIGSSYCFQVTEVSK